MHFFEYHPLRLLIFSGLCGEKWNVDSTQLLCHDVKDLDYDRNLNCMKLHCIIRFVELYIYMVEIENN
jgi:hypothetical protein